MANIVTGKNVNVFRMCVLRSALRLEVKGMRRRGRSAYAIVKEEFGLKGSKSSVLKQLERLIDEQNFGPSDQ